MKKNKIIFTTIYFVIILIIITLIFSLYKKNKELKKLKKNLIENNIENDNLKLAFESLLEIDAIDSVHHNNQIEIGLYFRKEGCFDCNFRCIQMLKRKIPPKYLCLYPNTIDSDYISSLKVKNLRVKYLNGSDYFQSTQPVIFVVLDGEIILKFYPNNDYPEITKMYINKISGLIK